MIRVYVHEGGETRRSERVDPSWFSPSSPVVFWVDMTDPDEDDGRLLSEVFHFHPLAVEDALAASNLPKVESYGEYLYLILHRIDFHAHEHCFRTHDVDFFLGRNYLVTIHSGESRSFDQIRSICERNARALGDGTPALMHRIIDAMVDNYRPEIDELSDRLDAIEEDVFQRTSPNLSRRILDFKRDVSSLRRVVQPERDVVGRLARREFPVIDEQTSFGFRDVYDHLVRLTDESMFFADRITGLLDAHLSQVSNNLNQVMKVLTVIATIFMPLTFVTGLYGMNVDLPHFGLSGTATFWLLMGLMLLIVAGMIVYFRRRNWI
ncbi:MAG TPA: magnesium/cobalt transporter CorA [Vicinamibacterales bacterium]|nr:magnesium/cobalt transporter CorA [Vicinamibacterales bacterium]